MSVERGGRQILVHGIALLLAGLVWGLVIPATPYPRLALTAHIQFEVNGLSFIVLALLLLLLPHGVGRRSVAVILLSVWLTWCMLLSEVANSWWGTTGILPIAAAQAGARGGEPWQELIVKLAHIGAAVGMIAAWGLLLAGFVRRIEGENA